MSNRSATDTIKGYFYQFDYSIEQLLNLTDELDEITIEGIEDIDIDTSDSSVAVQCKYYSKTEYNHSVISKPIRAMLTHFKELKEQGKPFINYHLYGYYKSGQDKLTLPIEVQFLKESFLSYTTSGRRKKHHKDLELTDDDLSQFLNFLSINIKVKEYERQRNDVLSTLRSIFSCDDFDSEYCLYNSALNEIRKLAIQDSLANRKITKKEFLSRIDKKEFLFNKWFLELKGSKQYFKGIKEKYFLTLNKSPFERFFIIEVPSDHKSTDLKELVHVISKKYSNLKKLEPINYCTYVYFNNLPCNSLAELKSQLYEEGFTFIDGHPYHGADFCLRAITVQATTENNINVKILSDQDQVVNTLEHISKTREVYQFYLNDQVLVQNEKIKVVNIQIQNLENIKEII